MKFSAAFNLAIFTGLFIGFQSAQATLNVCELLDQPVDSKLNVSSQQVSDYKQKLQKECDLYKKYVEVRDKAQSKFEVRLDQITVYQAMRYVQRSFYSQSQASNTPVQLTYQKLKSDYLKPNSEKSSEIWDNWVAGIKQLPVIVEQIKRGESFNIDSLSKAHVGFYTISDEKGDFSYLPYPGVLKPASARDNPWWKLKPEEVTTTQTVVDELNAGYKAMDLLTKFKNNQPDDIYINNLLNVKPVEDGFAIYSAETRANRTHLRDILNFMNVMLQQGAQNRPMIWNNRLMTPGEVAYFVQQFYVAIHPFYEGNGRTSRLLQEIVLTFFDMPNGSSGDLMDNDVLTNNENYYQMALAKNMQLLNEVKHCVDDLYKNAIRFTRKKIYEIDQNNLEYSCRIIK